MRRHDPLDEGRKIYRLMEVFTPTTPARATFVERDTINVKLVAALGTPGKQIVIYGHTGSGKTTLLANKLRQTYQDHITTRCSSGMSYDQILLNVFDQLERFYSSEIVSTASRKLSSSLQAQYAGIKADMGSERTSSTQTKMQRVVAPQLTLQVLARFLGEARCCWVLEDFHKVETTEKTRLAQAMKVFMDMADDYRDLKLIAVGAVDTARQVVELDPEMRNRVAEIFVPLMSGQEIEQIIERGGDLLNISFTPEVKRQTVHYSSGLASVCHQLCLNVCSAAGVIETSDRPLPIAARLFEQAVDSYIDGASDTLKAAFGKALLTRPIRKYDNVRLILTALLDSGPEGATRAEILKLIRNGQPRYSAGNLTSFLDCLLTPEYGEVVRFFNASNRYAFADPIYRAFAATLFSHTQTTLTIASNTTIAKLLSGS